MEFILSSFVFIKGEKFVSASKTQDKKYLQATNNQIIRINFILALKIAFRKFYKIRLTKCVKLEDSGNAQYITL
ncbi:hypothetical protein CMT79_10455 [Elizabethkingia anophelis]|nr:hypothetical protein [Elizabethkingia anophelis]MDV4027490.1 hypothetical protein [Elizabethkingia anophelis]